MKRLIDFGVASTCFVILAPVAAIVALSIRATSPGPVLYRSRRIGRGGEEFEMLKFRTMVHDAPQVATHLLTDAQSLVTPLGRWLRRTSLDELPQLVNVIRGQMSLVGPRPALFNQDDLIAMRDKAGINGLRPGVTGLAQLNGRDQLTLAEKVEFDRQYLEQQSVALDARLMLATVARILGDQDISH